MAALSAADHAALGLLLLPYADKCGINGRPQLMTKIAAKWVTMLEGMGWVLAPPDVGNVAMSAPNRVLTSALCISMAQQLGYAGLNTEWNTCGVGWVVDAETATWGFVAP